MLREGMRALCLQLAAFLILLLAGCDANTHGGEPLRLDTFRCGESGPTTQDVSPRLWINIRDLGGAINVRLANSLGKIVSEGLAVAVTPDTIEFRVKQALAPGSYYVRLYQSATLLKEMRLRVIRPAGHGHAAGC